MVDGIIVPGEWETNWASWCRRCPSLLLLLLPCQLSQSCLLPNTIDTHTCFFSDFTVSLLSLSFPRVNVIFVRCLLIHSNSSSLSSGPSSVQKNVEFLPIGLNQKCHHGHYYELRDQRIVRLKVKSFLAKTGQHVVVFRLMLGSDNRYFWGFEMVTVFICWSHRGTSWVIKLHPRFLHLLPFLPSQSVPPRKELTVLQLVSIVEHVKLSNEGLNLTPKARASLTPIGLLTDCSFNFCAHGRPENQYTRFVQLVYNKR